MKAIMIEQGDTAQSQQPPDWEQRLAARRRLAVRCMSLAAGLAVLAAALQLYDSFEGAGSLWRVLGSAAIALWWIAIAAFFRRTPR